MNWTIALTLLLGVAAGCSMNDKKQNSGTALNPAVTDVTAPAAPVAYTPPPAAPVQPVVYDATPQTVSATPAAASASSSRGTKYTVRKGDSLWKIAQSKYGNGNQWTKIASANPGLSANTIKPGQTIIIP